MNNDNYIRTPETPNIDIEYKKAETLKSIKELSLPNEAEEFYLKTGRSPETLIWYSRITAYSIFSNPSSKDSFRKEALQLVEALDERGYIRHDITPASFAIQQLYWKAFGRVSQPVAIEQLNNESYESFKNPSAQLVERVDTYLHDMLTSREYEVVSAVAGYKDGKPKTYAELAKKMELSEEHVEKLDKIALRKLTRYAGFQLIFMEANELEEEAKAVFNELRELNRRKAELRRKYRVLAKQTVSWPDGLAELFEGDIFENVDILELGLDFKAYSALRRADINTIEDILLCGDWSDFHNQIVFSPNVKTEIEEKMRERGYENFTIK
ncbi:MAG: hypothetical protein MJ154_03720 [Candidatus Saccharibacteria bacterium]|nr:hypothetical protein [Candidatus Saccharibacteria bacterium]